MLNQQVQEVIRQLIEGTKKRSISWTSESDEGDSLRADLGPGSVRISQGVAFKGNSGAPPMIIEFLDNSGRSLSQHRAETTLDYPPVRELFILARNQALSVDKTMSQIFEEIKRRSG